MKNSLYFIIKRIADIVFSVGLLMLLWPVFIVIALLIKIQGDGPVIFAQERLGKNSVPFKILKFRSMNKSAPNVSAHMLDNGNYVTKVGAFLRKTSLDELPQIFNVLMGDMSLVGPRPHAIQHDEEYSRRIDDYFARHNIKPGITGLAQVRGLRGETTDIDQMAQRIEADIEYINNWSVWLDLTILVRTTTAFTGKQAY